MDTTYPRLSQARGLHAHAAVPARRPAATTPYSISREVGPVVYFIRTPDDLIKVGHTARMDARKAQLTNSWQNLLALKPGTRADEAALHERFRPHLAYGREYYHPHEEILAAANEIRAGYGIPAVAAW